MQALMKPASPFRYSNSPPEVIRLILMVDVKARAACGCHRLALQSHLVYRPKRRPAL